jgi:predicted transposase YbfD/YdcC
VVDNPDVKLSSDFHEELNEGHGRKEIRRTWVCHDLVGLGNTEGWTDLSTIAVVASQRVLPGKEPTFAVRYYISSLKNVTAEVVADAVRAHWAIENNLHWTLDMAFREDECRIRNGHGAENFSTLRHIALNLLSKEKSQKIGIKNRRLLAGWDTNFLLKILGF